MDERPQYSSLFRVKVCNINKISQPSYLLGKEMLPECTVKSEYGTLKFNLIVIANYSNNGEELEDFTMRFDDIKRFMNEEDLSEKEDIAHFLRTNISKIFKN